MPAVTLVWSWPTSFWSDPALCRFTPHSSLCSPPAPAFAVTAVPSEFEQHLSPRLSWEPSAVQATLDLDGWSHGEVRAAPFCGKTGHSLIFLQSSLGHLRRQPSSRMLPAGRGLLLPLPLHSSLLLAGVISQTTELPLHGPSCRLYVSGTQTETNHFLQ